MKNILKSTGALLFAAAVTLFGCKEKELEAPDSAKPILITFDDFASGKFLDQTVQLSDVFFEIDDADTVGHLFNGTTSNASGTRILSNCEGKTLDVFTSGDRDFAFMNIPTGMGTIYGVASEFGGNKQLLLRSIDDVSDLINEKCEPEIPVFTIPQLLAGEAEEGATVKIENVEFSNITDTWGGGGPRTIVDCDGNSFISYVPSSASFANNTVPPGNGPLVGVLEHFQGTTWEIKPRSLADGVDMVNPLCNDGGSGGGGGSTDCDGTPTTVYISKDFEDANITSGGWINEVVTGSTNWVIGSFGGDSYIKASNFAGGSNSAAEVWYISPAIDLSGATAPALAFKNKSKFNGDQLQIMVSTDYTGSGSPTSATWTDLTSEATWDTDLADWGSFICTGNIDLTTYKSATTYVALKYTGSSSDGTTWQIDNIQVKE